MGWQGMPGSDIFSLLWKPILAWATRGEGSISSGLQETSHSPPPPPPAHRAHHRSSFLGHVTAVL